MYVFSGQTLLNSGIPSTTDPHTIRIFGNGGTDVPLDVNAPYIDDLRENAVFCSDGGTAGQLDASDMIIFYGRGTRGWRYAPATKTFSHYINHYTETNFGWLTYGNGAAKAMTQVPSQAQPSAYRPSTVTAKLFREDEKINILNSGLEWLGQPFGNGDAFTYVHNLPSLDVTQPVTYVARVGARSNGFSTFTIDEHSQRIATVSLAPTVVGDYFSNQFINSVVTRQQVPAFTDGSSSLKFGFTTSDANGSGYIDWYEIYYKQFPRAVSDVFTFHAHDTTALTEYAVTGFGSGQMYVFDVSAFDSAVAITNPEIAGDTCRFQIQLAAGNVKELFVVGAAGLKIPGALTPVANQNLHGDTASAAEIIITHPDFMSAAQRLKSYREQPGNNSLKCVVVNVNDVYNEFGGGIATPVAIRNYLRYAATTWSAPPAYALLLGDGDYDYKRISTAGPMWIPPWETMESFAPLFTYAGEDEFVTFNSTRRVGLALGRLAARSAAEANTMVDKIIEYETSSAKDPWKVRVTLVADDGLAGTDPDGSTHNDLFLHTQQAETMAGMVPPLFEKSKIFLYEYPTVYTPSGRRKPDVTVALENQINQGTVVLNFTGHGNPRVWTHEQVFVNETDFPALHNKGKYFYLVAATCNYSHVDMISAQSGGEQLMALPSAGAIAVLSATRPVFAGDNFSLNQSLYTYLFQIDNGGNIVQQRAGDAIFRMKQDNFSGSADNDRKFFLLGDPALRIGFPEKLATVDSINAVPATVTSTLRALSPVTVKATVRDSTNSGKIDFNGSALIVVFDANQQVLLQDSVERFNPHRIDHYSMTIGVSGSTLFRGELSVTNGAISSNFVVPKDISYGNDFGRMTMYFSDAAVSGAGYTTNFRVGGTDSTAPPDAKGPVIQLYLDSRSFRTGDVVSAAPVLLADLSDSSGINTSSSGIGHRLEAWLDGSASSIDMSAYYKSNVDTYRDGTITYPLGAMSQGSHRLKLRAWDTYNNSSTAETSFDVVTSVGLQLTNVVNFPNPTRGATVFTFEHNQMSAIDAEVKIYTVAGRLIQSIQRSAITESFVRIPWDGRDRDGDELANGVYLYKIIAKTQDNRFSNEALGKLSINK
jgi:hypothetical protein